MKKMKQIFEKYKLSLTLNISTKTSSNWTCRGCFGILMMSRFQNYPIWPRFEGENGETRCPFPYDFYCICFTLMWHVKVPKTNSFFLFIICLYQCVVYHGSIQNKWVCAWTWAGQWWSWNSQYPSRTSFKWSSDN